MKFTSSSLVAALAITTEAVLYASASNSPLSPAPRHHNGLVRRLKNAVGTASEEELESRALAEKRASYSGTATHYGAGVSEGACGVWSSYTDNVVALNIDLYGNENAISSWCGKKVVITGNGVTETATIVDCCPTCPGNGDLDMSTGLFQEFGITLDAGVFPITWHLQGDDSSSSTSHSSSQESSSSGLLQEILPSVTIAPVAVQSTHTIFSTVTASTPLISILAVTSLNSTVATSTKAANATVTTPAVPLSANAQSTATSTEPAQNLAGISELLAGMFNIANAVQRT